MDFKELKLKRVSDVIYWGSLVINKSFYNMWCRTAAVSKCQSIGKQDWCLNLSSEIFILGKVLFVLAMFELSKQISPISKDSKDCRMRISKRKIYLDNMAEFIIWKWTIKLDLDKSELKSLKQLQWFIILLNTWIPFFLANEVIFHIFIVEIKYNKNKNWANKQDKLQLTAKTIGNRWAKYV